MSESRHAEERDRPPSETGTPPAPHLTLGQLSDIEFRTWALSLTDRLHEVLADYPEGAGLTFDAAVRQLLRERDRLLRALETLARWQPPLSITGRPNMPALGMRDIAREALGLDPETGEPRTAFDKGHLGERSDG